MTKFIRMAAMAATSVAVLVSVSGTASAAGRRDCVLAGGTATIMPSNDVATFMANAALKNSIAAQGRTQVGPAKVVCESGALVPTCTAKAKACK